jgi:hypothetical protein
MILLHCVSQSWGLSGAGPADYRVVLHAPARGRGGYAVIGWSLVRKLIFTDNGIFMELDGGFSLFLIGRKTYSDCRVKQIQPDHVDPWRSLISSTS